VSWDLFDLMFVFSLISTSFAVYIFSLLWVFVVVSAVSSLERIVSESEMTFYVLNSHCTSLYYPFVTTCIQQTDKHRIRVSHVCVHMYRLTEEQSAWQRLGDKFQQQLDAAEQ